MMIHTEWNMKRRMKKLLKKILSGKLKTCGYTCPGSFKFDINLSNVDIAACSLCRQIMLTQEERSQFYYRGMRCPCSAIGKEEVLKRAMKL